MNAEWGQFGATPATGAAAAAVAAQQAAAAAAAANAGAAFPGFTPGVHYPAPPPTTSPLPPPMPDLGPHWSETTFAPPIQAQVDPQQVQAMIARRQQEAAVQGGGRGWRKYAIGFLGLLLLAGLGFGGYRWYTRRKVA